MKKPKPRHGSNPTKRLGQPSAIADTVAYLSSDAARYITGAIILVDGDRVTLSHMAAI